MNFRRVDLDGLKKPEAPSSGGESPAPQLQWIAIDRLVIDDSYQRGLTKQSRKTIERIAAEFDWAHFAPVIVAPVEGGFFAIIDGQHRAHAAALAGKAEVPCAIMICPARCQAAAFAAINNIVTRLHTTQIHRAAVAAGDPEAVRIEKLCASAGVTVLPHPQTIDRMKRGETTAVSSLKKLLAKFGDALARRTLSALAEGAREYKGLIYHEMMLGVALALQPRPELDGPALHAAFDRINLYQIEDQARAARLQDFSRSLSLHICEQIVRRLSARVAA